MINLKSKLQRKKNLKSDVIVLGKNWAEVTPELSS